MLGLQFETCNDFGLAFFFENCQVNHSTFFQMNIKKTIRMPYLAALSVWRYCVTGFTRLTPKLLSVGLAIVNCETDHLAVKPSGRISLSVGRKSPKKEGSG